MMQSSFNAGAGLLAASLLALAAFVPAGARAEPALDLGFSYTADISFPLSGSSDKRLDYLDNAELTLDADFAELAGWHGARAHVSVLANHGGRPNDRFGTLEGIDNIEVGEPGFRLFEAWLEQDIGGAGSIRAGLYDLNSEFYADDAAGLLLAPPFGIGSELAATGENGPSIFPSTALALRWNLPIGAGGGFVRLAAVNALASAWGDPGGVDLSLRDGLLIVGEGGVERDDLKLSAGLWGYSRRRDDLFHTGTAGLPERQGTWGAYAVAQKRVMAAGPAADGGLDLFARGGFASGDTTPFALSGQAGLLLAPALSGRPDSALTAGIHGATLSRAYRDLLRSQGIAPSRGEMGLELSYADRLGPITLQPDLQVVRKPGGAAAASAAVVGILRLGFEIP